VRTGVGAEHAVDPDEHETYALMTTKLSRQANDDLETSRHRLVLRPGLQSQRDHQTRPASEARMEPRGYMDVQPALPSSPASAALKASRGLGSDGNKWEDVREGG